MVLVIDFFHVKRRSEYQLSLNFEMLNYICRASVAVGSWVKPAFEVKPGLSITFRRTWKLMRCFGSVWLVSSLGSRTVAWPLCDQCDLRSPSSGDTCCVTRFDCTKDILLLLSGAGLSLGPLFCWIDLPPWDTGCGCICFFFCSAVIPAVCCRGAKFYTPEVFACVMKDSIAW